MYIYIYLIITSFFISSCTFNTEKLFKVEKTIIGTNKLDILNLKIKNGKTRKSYIVKKLGPPSTTNPFNENIIYYISQDMEHELGKTRKITKLVLLEIIFDKNDYVKSFQLVEKDKIKRFVLNDSKDNKFSDNRTGFRFLKDLLDNLRRRQEID